MWHVPELGVSTCGDTVESAGNIRVTVRGLIGAAEDLGMPTDVLEQAGGTVQGSNALSCSPRMGYPRFHSSITCSACRITCANGRFELLRA